MTEPSGKYLDVVGDFTSDGALVQQYRCTACPLHRSHTAPLRA